jgi:hypothetical protein
MNATENAGASPVVLISLRLPASHRKALTAKAAQETIRRGERVSVNTLIGKQSKWLSPTRTGRHETRDHQAHHPARA